MTDQASIMRDQVAAVHQLLVGKQRLTRSAAITGGAPLEPRHKVEIALIAAESQADLVHVEFAANDRGGFGIVGICLFIPRETRCWVLSDCRLWLGEGQTEARLIPGDDARGHFRLSLRELIHIDGKPDAIEEGVMRAHERLLALAPNAARTTRVYNYADLRAAA